MGTLSPALSDADRARLVKVLGLLASPHPGERDAAGCAAVRLLQDRKLGWGDVITPPVIAPQPAWSSAGQSRASWTAPSAWRDTARFCQCYPQALTDWETNFLDGLLSRRSLSTKQTAILSAIAAKVTGAGGAR